MAPPGTKHQRLVHFFDCVIEDYIQKNHGTCEVFPAPFGVFLKKDNKTYVEPDISVVCDPLKLDEKGCNGAPDWVIEIVSPSSRQMDYYRKLFLYQAAGVREYWIVDPEKKQVAVYHFEQNTGAEYAFGENVPSGIYDGFGITVQE